MSFRHFLGLLALLALLLPGAAAPPAWWATGVPPIITGSETNNRGPANIGQTKWMVAEALRALDTAAPTIALQIRADLAGTAPAFTNRLIDLTVPDPKPPTWIEAQKAPLLLGQLKAIAEPFYQHLNNSAPGWLTTERVANSIPATGSLYPWTSSLSDDANKSPATIGQLKATFSFHLTEDSDSNGSSDYAQYNLASGLAKHAKDALLSRTNGVTPNISTLPTFSADDAATANYTWNSQVWCNDLRAKLACVSVWNTKYHPSGYFPGKYAGAGTLITPRHVVGAAHYNRWMDPGHSIRFVGKSGTVYDRTVLAVHVLPNTDIEMAILDSDLPPDVTPAKIFPPTFTNWLGSASYRTPVIIRNQFGEARTLDLMQVTNGSCSYGLQTDPHLFQFHRGLVGGDSGGPAFMIVKGELGLLSTWSGSLSGPSYHDKNLQSGITALENWLGISTGYTPQVIDLTNFPLPPP